MSVWLRRGEIVEAVSRRQRRGESLRELVKQEMLRVLDATPPRVHLRSADRTPHVMLVVGVNGVGKTTTIGKLANQLKREGRTPLICAADTFRAAAVDQLQIWADRAGVDMVRAQGRLRSGCGRVRRDDGRQVAAAGHGAG